MGGGVLKRMPDLDKDQSIHLRSQLPECSVFYPLSQLDKKHTLQEVITLPSKLLTTKSTLKVPIISDHFKAGQLRAKCVASMLTMHWQSEDVVLKEESPTLASVVDSKDKAGNGTLANGGTGGHRSKDDLANGSEEAADKKAPLTSHGTISNAQPSSLLHTGMLGIFFLCERLRELSPFDCSIQ